MTATPHTELVERLLVSGRSMNSEIVARLEESLSPDESEKLGPGAHQILEELREMRAELKRRS